MANGIRSRATAVRAFIKEIRDSKVTTKENSNDPKSPTIVVSPLGAKLNRVFVVGALLDKDEAKPDSGIYRLRIGDPTGTISAYVSNYQPVALRQTLSLDPPCIVAVVGKVRTFERNNRIYTVIRPEYITVVDEETRNHWWLETLKATAERIKALKDGKLPQDVRTIVETHYGDRTKEFEEVVKRVHEILKEEFMIETAKEEEEPTEEELEEILKEDEEIELKEEEWDLSRILGKEKE